MAFSRVGNCIMNLNKKDEYYPRLERQLQPIAAVCERCKQQQQQYTMFGNTISWAAPGLQTWGNPSRLPPALQQQQRSFRGPIHPSGDYF